MKQSSLSLLIRVELLEAGLVASAEAQESHSFCDLAGAEAKYKPGDFSPARTRAKAESTSSCRPAMKTRFRMATSFQSPRPTVNWLVLRGFLKDGDAAPGVKNIKDNFKLYPLGKTASASKVAYHDMSMKYLNTIHASDVTFFDHINEIVQYEPNEAQDPEILGLLRSIGIEKGKPFKPDARMEKILKDAANVGSAASRVVLYRSRDPEALVYPDSGWEHPWVGNSSTFEHNGVRLLDARTRFRMYATGITPSMVTPKVGQGTQYIAGMRDSQGRPFDGGKEYKLHLPPEVPANNFWAVTIYDVQTRSMLQTNQRFPEITSADKAIEQNADGSYDVYFGRKAPEGKENNWIETVPGKGWHILFRLYGPEQAWFDKTWRPGEVELVK